MAISDVLFEAREQIDDYLSKGMYTNENGEIDPEILAVRAAMQRLQIKLDRVSGCTFAPGEIEEIMSKQNDPLFRLRGISHSDN